MVFKKLTCPGCNERILVDDRDGKGFCMYCGEELDTSGVATVSHDLGQLLREYLDRSIPGEGYDWFPSFNQAATVLYTQGTEAAAPLFAALYDEDMDEEEVETLHDSIVESIGIWMTDMLMSHECLYTGGCMELVEAIGPWFSEEGKTELIVLTLTAMRERTEWDFDEDGAAAIIVALYHIMRDTYSISADPAFIGITNGMMAEIQGIAVEALEEYYVDTFEDEEDEEEYFEEEWMVDVIGEVTIACNKRFMELLATGKTPEDIMQDVAALKEATDAMLDMMDGKPSPVEVAGVSARYFDQIFRMESKAQGKLAPRKRSASKR